MFEIIKDGDEKYKVKTSINIGVIDLETNENKMNFRYEGNIRVDRNTLKVSYGNALNSFPGVSESEYAEDIAKKFCNDLIEEIAQEIYTSLSIIGMEEFISGGDKYLYDYNCDCESN